MEKFRKLKTFENYEKAGGDAKPKTDKVSDEVINNKIKEVVANILKTKEYFMLLQDTAEHVYEMIEKQIPPNVDAFSNSLNDKDEMLGGLVDDLLDLLDNSNTLTELDEIVMVLRNIDQYTEDNMDNILKGLGDDDEDDDDDDDDGNGDEHICPKCEGTGENKRGIECDACNGTGFKPEYDEEEEDEDEDDDDDYIEMMQPKKGKVEDDDSKDQFVEDVEENEDQLERKPKKLGESKKPMSDLERKIKSFAEQNKPKVLPKKEEPKKEESKDKFKKGDVVYIGGIKGHAIKYNGKKCTVVQKGEEDTYDLHDPSSKVAGVNIQGMPEKYLSKEPFPEKPEPVKRAVKPRATRKKKDE